MPTEADARIVVDRLLREAGWDIEDKSQVSTEEPAADGRADYLLRNQRTQPLAPIEAKRFSIDPYSAKERAREYAVSLAAPFVILSNGREHYFWDYEDGDARPIVGLPSRADLERRANLRQHRRGSLAATLRAIPYPANFRFKGEDVQARPHQIGCLRAADDALLAGRRRMLFEKATGTGKTLTIAMLMKRWFQAAVISRVLFLADRIELARQAKETFDDYLKEYPSTILFGGQRSLEGQIVVGTLETIASQLGPGGFGHAYFDLVVTDECHRSIYNTHRATLAHFDAIHIGLTATPNPGELRWINEHERQLVRSTYMFFDCWDSAAQQGRPTFSYGIRDGIKDGFLADYSIYVAESRLTFEGTTWEDEDIAFSDWGRNAESEDRLSPAQWEFLQRGTLHLFEADKDIIRMAAMNAVLHGFDHSPIVRRDSIGGSEDKWDEIQFDCILENPPFSGAGLAPKRSLRVEKGDKYVLFLAAALRSLRPGGRAGIVLPNGILFGDTNAHLEVKKRLLAEFDLQAVVTLPKGMFEPYTPNPTCFLIFQKTGKPTKETWFYRVEGDGSSLKKARKFGPQFPNDFPDLLAKWPKRQTEEGRAWRVPAKQIIDNGYNMTLASLGLVEPEKTDHAEPEDILASIAEKERRILQVVQEMRELVAGEKEGGK